MRAWMPALVVGMLPVPLLPALPGRWTIALLICFGLLALYPRRWCWRTLSGLSLGAALALAHGHWLLQGRLSEECVGTPLVISGKVSSLPRISTMPDETTRQRFELVVETLHPVACAGPRRILLSYYGGHLLQPGQHWRFEARLKKPWGLANPGSHNMQSWYAESGIDALGSVRADRATALRQPPGWTDIPDRLRFHIRERIASLRVPPDVSAVLAAITVADKSGIDSRLWSLFQLYGINHLLVISGLHIGLVGGGGLLLGVLAQRGLLLAGISLPWLPSLLGLVCAAGYTALAGFTLSTQRALCMLSCFLLAGLSGRHSRAANSLLLAAVAVLLLNPLALLGSGLWLSFGAVAALLWLGQWQQRLPRWRRVIAVHGYMSLVMLPLGGWWFGGGSLVAPVANLVMIPLVGIVVVPLALLAVLAMFLIPLLEPLLWALAAWPLEQLLPRAAQMANGNDRWLYWQLAPSLPAVLLAALGAALLVMPSAARLRLIAILLFLPLLLPAAGGDAVEPGVTRVSVLDVGQGTAVVLQAGARVLVYDTGGGDPAGANMAAAVLLPFLRQQGVGALDTFIVSHPDNDHSAGVATLLDAMPVRRVFYGGDMDPPDGAPCVAGHSWEWSRALRFRFLSPALEAQQGLRSNNASCVLQIEAAGHSLLLAGDIEVARERQLVQYWGLSLASDWLLLPHHGSNTSTSHTFLKHVRPAVAVISSGYANRFGHPHQAVLDRLQKAGVRYYDTADSGALTFEFRRGEPVAVRRYRDQLRRFWM